MAQKARPNGIRSPPGTPQQGPWEAVKIPKTDDFSTNFRLHIWCENGHPKAQGINQICLRNRFENLPEIFKNRGGARLEFPLALGASLQHTSQTILNKTTAKRRNQANAEHPTSQQRHNSNKNKTNTFDGERNPLRNDSLTQPGGMRGAIE